MLRSRPRASPRRAFLTCKERREEEKNAQVAQEIRSSSPFEHSRPRRHAPYGPLDIIGLRLNKDRQRRATRPLRLNTRLRQHAHGKDAGRQLQ